MGVKWSTWRYRFIWSAIWVFLLSRFFRDWSLSQADVSRYSDLGPLFMSRVPSHFTSKGINCKWNKWIDSVTQYVKAGSVNVSESEAMFVATHSVLELGPLCAPRPPTKSGCSRRWPTALLFHHLFWFQKNLFKLIRQILEWEMATSFCKHPNITFMWCVSTVSFNRGQASQYLKN